MIVLDKHFEVIIYENDPALPIIKKYLGTIVNERKWIPKQTNVEFSHSVYNGWKFTISRTYLEEFIEVFKPTIAKDLTIRGRRLIEAKLPNKRFIISELARQFRRVKNKET